ncbi:hypothetical protein DFH09DRAFT_1175627 [Mycena vulgaris]|nr:hypothetical protein DFH09DRAFT_1175627 [Mycena vulgaris]
MAEDPPVSLTLPFELERQIFELTALARPVSIPNLMRVAWRVKHWVEPLLYRTLVIGEPDTIDGIPSCSVERFMHIAHTKSATFLHNSVRNLLVSSVGPQTCKKILLACTGIENLSLLPVPSAPDDSRAAVDFLSLRHLYCDFENLCDLIITFGPFAQPSFSRLTHLELFDGLLHNKDDDPVRWAGITALPHLTHLSLDTYRVLPILPHLLNACKSLRALIILCHRPRPMHMATECATLGQDPRFVVMPLEDYSADWQKGVLNGDDYWARADVFIAKKISGEIARESPLNY